MRHRMVLGKRALSLFLVGFAFGACDAANTHSLHGALTSLGVEDPPTQPPLTFQIFCDRSIGSPCEHGLAMQTVERVVRTAYARPLSHVEVFVMGSEVAATRRVASVTIPARADRGERAARVAEERFLENVRPMLCLPLGDELTRSRTHTSPIFESLDKVSLTRVNALPVELFAITDLRDVSDLADFECGALPNGQQLTARLDRRGLLASGTYTHTRVHFVVGDNGPVPRRDCAVSMSRVRTIQTLFQGVLLRAGAEEVTFHTEVPDVDALLATHPAHVPDAGALPVAAESVRAPRTPAVASSTHHTHRRIP